MDEYQVRIGEQIVAAPTWWFDAVLVWFAAMGIVLLLLGRRLIRPIFGALGLCVGAGLGWLVCQMWLIERWEGVPVMIFVIVGGVIGALAAALMWRLGVGVILALSVAIIAPSAYVIFSGTEPPEIVEPVLTGRDTMNQTLEDSIDKQPEEVPEWTFEPIRSGVAEAIESLQTWWDGLTAGQQWILSELCIGGAIIALFIGMALPLFGASVATALIGTLLMVGLIYRGAEWASDGSASFLPDTPRGFLWLLLSFTLIGTLVQWTLLRPRQKEVT